MIDFNRRSLKWQEQRNHKSKLPSGQNEIHEFEKHLQEEGGKLSFLGTFERLDGRTIWFSSHIIV